jgi:hypothetical protein
MKSCFIDTKEIDKATHILGFRMGDHMIYIYMLLLVGSKLRGVWFLIRD